MTGTRARSRHAASKWSSPSQRRDSARVRGDGKIDQGTWTPAPPFWPIGSPRHLERNLTWRGASSASSVPPGPRRHVRALRRAGRDAWRVAMLGSRDEPMRRTNATPTTPPSSPAQAAPAPAPTAGRRAHRAAGSPRRRPRCDRFFSQGALAAIERAALLLSAGSTLHLVHVLPAPASPAEGRARSRPRGARSTRSRPAPSMSPGARGTPGLQVAPSVLVGREFVEIIRHARSRGRS